MGFTVGIDLGTTNTVVSTARRGAGGGVEVMTEKLSQMGEDGRRLVQDTLLPSFLYIEDKDHLVGRFAKAMKGQRKNNVVACCKNYMGQRNQKWLIEDRVYTPELVSSYYLSAIRNYLLSRYNDEESIDNAVITVPASFDLDQRNSTKQAAVLAGFKGDITLIAEPTAAVLDFINEQSKILKEDRILDFSSTKTVLVFDLGGGTCDVSILKIRLEDKKVFVEEVNVSPHTLIGGTTFDLYAVEGLLLEYENANNLVLKDILSKEELQELKARLVMTLEDIKVFFSDKYTQRKVSEEEKEKLLEEISIPVMEPGAINGKAFKHVLTMKSYNEFIKPLFSIDNKMGNIIEPIENTLNMANITKEEIDYVFTVGGMTRYPAVLEAVSKYLGKEPLKFFDTMESVSRGAAIYRYYEIEKLEATGDKLQKEVTIIPKLPQSIFLNVKNGFPITLIEANTKAGTPIIIKDAIRVTSEVKVVLELFAGRSIFDPDLKTLENITLAFPYGVKLGSKITLRVEYTEKGEVKINAWLEDNKDIKINISLEDTKLTTEEIVEIKEGYKIAAVEGVY